MSTPIHLKPANQNAKQALLQMTAYALITHMTQLYCTGRGHQLDLFDDAVELINSQLKHGADDHAIEQAVLEQVITSLNRLIKSNSAKTRVARKETATPKNAHTAVLAILAQHHGELKRSVALTIFDPGTSALVRPIDRRIRSTKDQVVTVRALSTKQKNNDLLPTADNKNTSVISRNEFSSEVADCNSGNPDRMNSPTEASDSASGEYPSKCVNGRRINRRDRQNR
jgi:hypothetical protein